ncbi:MAG: response regulator [Lachnospiraceae bacterium]|jgi:CheY-like chemotaxis protein|nr:response regulator [Lachnospiraceae bacterium]
MNNTQKYSVLIVDDENSNIMILTKILSPDYVVFAAKEGRSAIQAAEKYVPDVILLDIVMEDMDGFAVLSELKKSPKTCDIPVIFVSGLSNPRDEERGFLLGVDDYITKPFSPAKVRLRVKNQVKLLEQFRANEYDIKKYKLANDALHIALWDMEIISDDPINPDNIMVFSQEFREMLGFEDENDFPNQISSWMDRLHSDDKQRTMDAFAAHISDRTKQIEYNVEYRLLNKNGEYRYYQALGTSSRGRDDAPVRIAGALVDINDKKLNEEAVEKQNSMLHAVNEAALLLTAAGSGELTAMITRSLEILGRSINADRVQIWQLEATENGRHFIHTHCWESDKTDVSAVPLGFTIPYGANPGWESELMVGRCVSGPISNMLSAEQPFFTEYNVKSTVISPLYLDDKLWGLFRVDDCEEERNFSEYEVAILWSASRMLATVINKNAIADIIHKTEVAIESNRLKSAFLATMSHEIRTPMSAILGLTQIISQEENLPDVATDGLKKIHNSCNMLMGIINDLLDLSKIEAGKLDIVPSVYSIASTIDDTVQMNVMRIGDKPILFEIQLDENIPARMIGDELRIKQIFNNLLSNAIKYTEAGKVILSLSYIATSNKGALIMSIKDTGIGMTHEQVDALFHEYSRFVPESGRLIEGTGLGLTITKNLISLMNGEIYVESEPGAGSLFTVKLPQEKADDEVIGRELADSLMQMQTQQRVEERKLVCERMPYGRALIVDDVETNLYIAEAFLKPYEMQVETAMSGFEAIDKVKSGKTYSIILMDHMMPKMDGIEATKQLRQLGFTNPIVALTANALVGQEAMFLENGFDAFISKPIDTHLLDKVLNELVRDKQPPEVLEAVRQGAEKPKVLTINDNPVILKTINSMLKGLYKVSALPEPKRVREIMEAIKPDLILTSNSMMDAPIMEVMAAIREEDKSGILPVILLAQGSNTDLTTEAANAGACDVIIEPINETELRAKVAEHTRDFMKRR